MCIPDTEPFWIWNLSEHLFTCLLACLLFALSHLFTVSPSHKTYHLTVLSTLIYYELLSKRKGTFAWLKSKSCFLKLWRKAPTFLFIFFSVPIGYLHMTKKESEWLSTRWRTCTRDYLTFSPIKSLIQSRSQLRITINDWLETDVICIGIVHSFAFIIIIYNFNKVTSITAWWRYANCDGKVVQLFLNESDMILCLHERGSILLDIVAY